MKRLFALLTLTACGAAPDDALEERRSDLGASARRARATLIRDVARMNGLTNGALLGGIADTETGLAHCWSEATWACQGPSSTSCAGGPVIAGAGDGPCELREGGLGMFQFDGGTFDETLARDGEEILTIEGNVANAVDFVRRMVVRSQFIEGIDDEASALAWMNAVPIQPGDARYEAWISTVVRHYNGASPSNPAWDRKRERYGSRTTGMITELGAGFWAPEPPAPPPEDEPVDRPFELPPEGEPAQTDADPEVIASAEPSPVAPEPTRAEAPGAHGEIAGSCAATRGDGIWSLLAALALLQSRRRASTGA